MQNKHSSDNKRRGLWTTIKTYLMDGFRDWTRQPVVHTLNWLGPALGAVAFSYFFGATKAGELNPQAVFAWIAANWDYFWDRAGWIFLLVALLTYLFRLAQSRRRERIANKGAVVALGLTGCFQPSAGETDAHWINCRQILDTLKPTELCVLCANGWETFAAEEAPLRSVIDSFTGSLRILLLAPNSVGFTERIDELVVDAFGKIDGEKRDIARTRFVNEYNKTIAFCHELAKKPDFQLRFIEVKVYSDKPIWKFVFANNYVWVQYYPIGEHGVNTPWYVFAHAANRDSSFQHAFWSVWRQRWKDPNTESILRRD